MTYEYKTLKVTELLLDEKNPRFPAVKNQKEAIRAMIEDQGEKIVALAKDICKEGLDPSKRMIVFYENGKLIDGDGNRRLTVLKILETPSLADSNPSIKKKLDVLRNQYKTFPRQIECVVLNSRDAARHWIEINHSGELEGRGQIPWNPEQKDRFNGVLSIGLQALSLLIDREIIEEREKEEVGKTTFDRMLDFKITRNALSITKSGENYEFGDIDRLHKLFDAMKGVKVETVYRADIAKSFLERVLGDLTPSVPDSDHSADAKAQPDQKTKTRARTKRSKQNPHVVFGGRLVLRSGDVNDLYRDIESLYGFYQSQKKSLTANFIALFRMSLRLLADTAAIDLNENLDHYLENRFDAAKLTLDKDSKTTLSNQGIHKKTIVKLLQTGAHNYMNSKNEEQAIALSLILGAILLNSHGK